MLSQLPLQLQADSLLLCAAGQRWECAVHAVHAVGLHVWAAGQAGAAPGLQQHPEGVLLPASALQVNIPSPPANSRSQRSRHEPRPAT